MTVSPGYHPSTGPPPHPTPLRRGRGANWESFAQGALVAWFLLTRVQQFLASQPVSFPDSASFLAKAGTRVLSIDFLFGNGRLFTVPLVWAPFIQWFHDDGAIVSWVQLVLACCAWLLLAGALAAHLQTPLGRVAGRALVLALACTSDVTQWDRTLLSESISTSLFVGLMAAWLWWGSRSSTDARPTRAALGAIVALAVLWGFARESNGLFLLMLAGAALLLTVTTTEVPARARRRRREAAAMALVFAAVFAGSQLAAERGERWLFPLLNVIGRRVLPSQERTAFYAAAGMPVSPALTAMSGAYASGRDWSFYESPALEDFRAWVRTSGRHTYLLDLARNPARTLSEPLADARQFLCPDLNIYRPPGFVPAAPALAVGPLCSERTARDLLVAALGGGVLASLLGLLVRRRVSFATQFLVQTLALLLIAWPVLTWLTWHAIGDMEVSRHVLWATLFLRLGLVIAAAWLIDLIARAADLACRRAGSASA